MMKNKNRIRLNEHKNICKIVGETFEGPKMKGWRAKGDKSSSKFVPHKDASKSLQIVFYVCFCVNKAMFTTNHIFIQIV